MEPKLPLDLLHIDVSRAPALNLQLDNLSINRTDQICSHQPGLMRSRRELTPKLPNTLEFPLSQSVAEPRWLIMNFFVLVLVSRMVWSQRGSG